MDRQQKSEQVEALRGVFGDTQLMVLTNFSGLNVESMVELRAKLRQAGSGYRVVKNTLARLALADTHETVSPDFFTGPVGVAYSNEEPSAAAKVVSDFIKDHPKLEVSVGFLADGKVIDASQIEALGKLPGKDQLRAQLLGTISGVPRNFLGVLNATPRNFVGVLEARRQSLEGE
jgi:large subunit ribosomal protein L10